MWQASTDWQKKKKIEQLHLQEYDTFPRFFLIKKTNKPWSFI